MAILKASWSILLHSLAWMLLNGVPHAACHSWSQDNNSVSNSDTVGIAPMGIELLFLREPGDPVLDYEDNSSVAEESWRHEVLGDPTDPTDVRVPFQMEMTEDNGTITTYTNCSYLGRIYEELYANLTGIELNEMNTLNFNNCKETFINTSGNVSSEDAGFSYDVPFRLLLPHTLDGNELCRSNSSCITVREHFAHPAYVRVFCCYLLDSPEVNSEYGYDDYNGYNDYDGLNTEDSASGYYNEDA